MWSRNGLKAPPLGLSVAALKPGANGRAAIVSAQAPPPGAASSLKSPLGVAAGLPVQGVSEVVVVCGPQVCGLVSGARGPSLKSSLNEVKGTCGRPGSAARPSFASSNTVVSRPVWGSAFTLPISRAEIP